MLRGALFGLLTVACAARYAAPDLPAEKLAFVVVDDRATVQTVDGLQPGNIREPASERRFELGPGCRRFLVVYEETFMQDGQMAPGLLLLAPVAGVAQGIATSGIHTYSTDKPIVFNVQAKAGRKYWVTASFNGSQFFPRVAEIDPVSNETVAEILPDGKCP
ncbi:MAG TPA: hypothetical protein VGQ57_20980 [Polyangiaceae bacterium]|nr:hypothetical protein [Polyangiaceae bacterium]